MDQVRRPFLGSLPILRLELRGVIPHYKHSRYFADQFSARLRSGRRKPKDRKPWTKTAQEVLTYVSLHRLGLSPQQA
jgi:hypothetical protein